MIVIDAHTGLELQVGDRVRVVGGGYLRLLNVWPGIFTASAVVQYEGEQEPMPELGEVEPGRLGHTGRMLFSPPRPQGPHVVPLIVRWLHPGFVGRHVGFIPT